MMSFLSPRFALSLATLLLSGLGASACSSSDTAEPSSDPNAALKDWLVTLADAQCAATAPCCVQAELPHDQDYCREAVADAKWNEAQQALAAGATFEPTAAEACLNAIATMDCASRLTLPGVCSEALRASAPAGASCQADFECARASEGHSLCASNSTCMTLIPDGSVGAVCRGESVVYTCGQGLTCDTRASVCLEAVEGSSCLNSYDCAPADYCDTAGKTSESWFCTARAKTGELCGDVECVTEASCESGTCQLKLPAMASCHTNDECQNGSCDKLNGRCKFFDWCTAP